jgi:hypothetical protein
MLICGNRIDIAYEDALRWHSSLGGGACPPADFDTGQYFKEGGEPSRRYCRKDVHRKTPSQRAVPVGNKNKVDQPRYAAHLKSVEQLRAPFGPRGS